MLVQFEPTRHASRRM